MKIFGHARVPATLLFLLSGLGYAQTATITGTLTDPSGAVVPAITVTVVNMDTNAPRSMMADARGNYEAPVSTADRCCVPK